MSKAATTSADTVPGDNEVTRITVDAMDDEALMAHIEGLHERRFAAYRIFQLAEEVKRRAQEQATREKFTKQLNMFKKEHAAAEKAIEKLEKRVRNLQGLRIEIGEYNDDASGDENT